VIVVFGVCRRRTEKENECETREKLKDERSTKREKRSQKVWTMAEELPIARNPS
jgi:hypothetical protein